MFSRCIFLSFVKSFNQILSPRKQLRMFFLNFIVLLCPFFFCFQSVFSPLLSRCFLSFTFTLFFPALYNTLCTKTTLNVVTLVSHSQETGDKNKRALSCYNARSVTNHIADFLLLIL